MWETQFFHILIHLQAAIYLTVIFLTLRKVKRIYLENYASSNIDFLKWLFQITLFLTSFHSIALLKNIFKFSAYTEFSEVVKIALGFLMLGILCWYLLKALKQPELFRSVDSNLQLVGNMVLQLEDNVANGNTSQLDALKDHMSLEEPFLEPSLTVQQLATQTNIPVKELSILINHKLGQHFFDFINAYRIKKAMQILEDSTKNRHTILEILYEVGFNSKSSFNTAFKKHTGTTPTLYRKNVQNQPIR